MSNGNITEYTMGIEYEQWISQNTQLEYISILGTFAIAVYSHLGICNTPIV